MAENNTKKALTAKELADVAQQQPIAVDATGAPTNINPITGMSGQESLANKDYFAEQSAYEAQMRPFIGVGDQYTSKSKYDKNMSIADMSDVEAYRETQQGLGEAFLNGLISRALSVPLKFLEGFGYVATAPLTLLNSDPSTMTDNFFSNAMRSMDEGLREVLPVYTDPRYREDNILKKMSTAKFWFDDLFDGFAFMASAAIPVGAIGKAGSLAKMGAAELGAAGKLTRAAAEGTQFFSKGAEALSGTLRTGLGEMAEFAGLNGKRMAALNQTLRNTTAFKTIAANQKQILVAAYNTISEAGFEAKDTYNQVYNELMKDPNMTPERAKAEASIRSQNTFFANAAILLGPNFIQSAMMMGGLKFNNRNMRRLVRENIDNLESVALKPWKKSLRDFAIGVGSEGLWEEGMQNAVQNYELKAAKGEGEFDSNLFGYVDEWLKGLTTTEGQHNMILGAIIGGGMGAVTGITSAKAENRAMQAYGEEWKKYSADYLTQIDKIFNDRVEDINNPDGTISPERAAKAFYRTLNDRTLFDEGIASAINNDKFRDDYNKRMAAGRYMWEFVNDSKNFETPEEAAEYAKKRLQDSFNPETTSEEEVEKAMNYMDEFANTYNEVGEKIDYLINSAKDPVDRVFLEKVKKAVTYEMFKQKALEEYRNELSGEKADNVQKAIDDSKQKVEYLLNKKEREKIKSDYFKVRGDRKQLLDANTRIAEINKQIQENKSETGDPLKEEDITKLVDEKKRLIYDITEYGILYGKKQITPFDINISEQTREAENLGIQNDAYMKVGMSYKKKIQRDKALSVYRGDTSPLTTAKDGTPSQIANTQANELKAKSYITRAEDVFNAIVNNTSEEYSPYTREDKKALEELKKDLTEETEAIEAKEDIDSLEQKVNSVLKDPTKLLTRFKSEDEFKKAQQTLLDHKEASNLLDNINNILDNETFNNLEKNATDSLKSDKMKAKAMNRFIDDNVNPIISSYESNPNNYSNISDVNRALEALNIAELALNDASRNDLKESPYAKQITNKIEKLRKKLADIEKVAQENYNDKQAADANNKRSYGIVRKGIIVDDEFKNTLKKYLGADVDKWLKDMTDDDENYVFIEKILNAVKTLPDDKRQIVINMINTKINDYSDYLTNMMSKHFATAVERRQPLDEIDDEWDRDFEKESREDVLKKEIPFINKVYKQNPTSMLNRILMTLGYKTNTIEDTPTKRYFETNDIVRYINDIKMLGDNEDTGTFLNKEELLDILGAHQMALSFFSAKESIDSKLVLRDDFQSQLNNFIEENKEGKAIAPSEQQRIAIFEIDRWLDNPEYIEQEEIKYSNGDESVKAFGAQFIGYLKGIAGTGKTTVVGRLVMKLRGIKPEEAFGIGNNESATKTLNDSLGLTGDKTIVNVEKSDLENKKIVFVDEVGAMHTNDWSRFTLMIGEINTERIKNSEQPIKVLAMGDPAQIRNRLEATIPIEQVGTNDRNMEMIRHFNSLTVPFRSNVSSIIDLQSAFFMNNNLVKDLTVVASGPIGTDSIGVHSATNKDQILSQIKVKEGNGKTKVVIVANKNDVDKYKSELSSIDSSVDVLTYYDVQGRTYDEVFIDIRDKAFKIKNPNDIKEVKRVSASYNKVMYTATSRARDYIMILDNAGFKNSERKSVENDNAVGEVKLDEAKKSYEKNIKRDINILDGKEVKKEEKKDEKTEPEIPSVDDAKDNDDKAEDEEVAEEEDEEHDEEYPPVEDDEDNESPDVESNADNTTPVTTSVDAMTEIINSYKNPETPGYHTVKHTKNVPVPDPNSPTGIGLPYKEGDTVYYIKVKDGKGGTMIKGYVKVGEKAYEEVSLLSDEESQVAFGMSVDELKKNASKSVREPSEGLKEFAGGTLPQDAVVATGTISAPPIPLTYVFNEEVTYGEGLLEDVEQTVIDVFEKNGFKHKKSYVKIFRTKEAQKMVKVGIQPGRPYMVFKFEAPSGTEITQYIKLVPRKLNRNLDSDIINPVESFVSSIKEAEKILERFGDKGKLGSEEFNNLMKSFKVDYQVSSDAKTIERKQTPVLDLDTAIKNSELNELTQKDIEDLRNVIDPIIKGFYGVGYTKLKYTEEEFKKKFIDSGNYEKGEFEGTEYWRDTAKGRWYRLVKKKETDDTGYVEQREVIINKKTKKEMLVHPDDRSGTPIKYLQEPAVMPGKGAAQKAIDKLAKSNNIPNNVNIRTVTIKKSNKEPKKFYSGKSLFSSITSYTNYFMYLKSLAITHGIPLSELRLKGDKVFTDAKILTEEELEKERTKRVTIPLTSDSLEKALGFESSDQESSNTTYFPININDSGINELGEDINGNGKALNELVGSNFHSVFPTSVQIKIDDDVKKPDETTEETKKTVEEPIGYNPIDVDSQESLFDDEDMDDMMYFSIDNAAEKGKEVSKKTAVKMIEKRLGRKLKEGEIKFVKDIAGLDFMDNNLGAFFNGVIYLYETDAGTVYENVVKHEAFHKIWNEVLTPDQKARLRKAFINEEKDVNVAVMNSKEFEEFAANKYHAWKEGDYSPKSGFIKSIFEYLLDLFRVVGNNRYFIEALFRDITSGVANKYPGYSLNGAKRNLRKDYKDNDGSLRYSIAVVKKRVYTLAKYGFNGYPVASSNIKDVTKESIKQSLGIVNKKLKTAIMEYENALEDDSLGKEKKNELLQKHGKEINKLQKRAKQLSILHKNFDNVFKVAYPTWNTGSEFFNVSEDLSEDEYNALMSGPGITDDIIDWDRVNMEAKVSWLSKKFLANIEYEGKILNERYAYLATLKVLDGVYEQHQEASKAIRNKIRTGKINDPREIAIANEIIRLHDNVVDGETQIPEGSGSKNVKTVEVKKTGMFLKDGSFVYVDHNSVGEDFNINHYGGIKSLEQGGYNNYNVINSPKGGSFNQFVNYIVSTTNYTHEDVYAMYQYYRDKETLRAIMSNFLSQRERSITFLEINGRGKWRSFNYRDAASQKAIVRNSSRIKNTLSNMTSVEIENLINHMSIPVDKAKTTEDHKQVVILFLRNIGLDDLADQVLWAPNRLITNAFNRIDYFINVSNVLEEKRKIENSKIPATGDEISDVADDTDDAARQKEGDSADLISEAFSSLTNDIAKVISNDQRIVRSSSVRSVGGEKKYKWVLSGNAHMLLNLISRGGISKKLAPDYLSSDVFRKNIFLNENTDNKIYRIVDYDGAYVTNQWGMPDVVEYKNEPYDIFMDRNIFSQFFGRLGNASKTTPTYEQSLYIISNKTNTITSTVTAMNPKQVRMAIMSNIEQFLAQKSYPSIKSANGNKILNNNALAEAIEKVIPGSTQIETDKNGNPVYYIIKEEARDKIAKNKEKIADAMYNNIIDLSIKTINNLKRARVSIPVQTLLNDNVKKLIDKDRFKDINYEEIKYVKVYNWRTGEVETTKEAARSIEIIESVETVKARAFQHLFEVMFFNRAKSFLKEKGINEFSEDKDKLREIFKKHDLEEAYSSIHSSSSEDAKFSTLEEYKTAYEENGLDKKELAPKQLYDENVFVPYFAVFHTNDYLNSRGLTELISGPFMFFNSDNDLNKRLSGASSPGVRPWIHDEFGTPRYSQAVVIDDATFDTPQNTQNFLKRLGLSDKAIEKLVKKYGVKPTEYTDGQGFVLPERVEELTKGLSQTYGLGNTMKPAYYGIDEDGKVRMIKYATIELTDELINDPAFAPLKILAEKMRKQGVMEAVFASGVKVGVPTEAVDLNDIFKDDYEFDLGKSGFIIDNMNYRLQLNPNHEVDSDVANPIQLNYFENIKEEDEQKASVIYKSIANLMQMRFLDVKDDMDTYKGMANIVNKQLASNDTYMAENDLYSALKSDNGIVEPWNYPGITELVSRQLISYISKNSVQVRYPGSKLVLQTAFGTELFEGDKKLEEMEAGLNYKLKDGVTLEQASHSDILYVEVILPKGLLPADIEEEIEKGGKDAPARFIYGDLLGFRIPSSELHSALPLKVVGFYPKNSNIIVAPKEIVNVHGSDYDVDSLFVISREYERKTVNGKKVKGDPIGYDWDRKLEMWVFNYDLEGTDDFNNKPKEWKEKYYKNAVMESFLWSITSTHNRERMLMPIAFDVLNEDLDELDKLESENQDNIIPPDSSDINRRQAVHASATESLLGTGIFANAIKAIAYLQRSGEKRTNPTISEPDSVYEHEIYTDSILDKDRKSIIWYNKGIPVEANTLSSRPEMWEILDSLLNAAIDNVKEQILPKINLTSKNMKAYIAFIAFDVGEKDFFKLANRVFKQNFVKVANILDSQGGINAVTGIINDILEAYEIEQEEILSPLSIQWLERSIKSGYDLLEISERFNAGEKLSDGELRFVIDQASFLREYKKAENIGSELSKYSKMMNTLKEIPNQKEELDKLSKITDDISKGLFNTPNLFDNLPHLRSAVAISEYVKDTYETRFFRYNKWLAERLSHVFRVNKTELDSDYVVNNQKRVDEFIKFVTNSVDWDPQFNGFEYEPERETQYGEKLYGERAFEERIIESVKVMQKDPNTKNNLLVASLSVQPFGYGNKIIALDSASLDYVDAIDLEKAFEELQDVEIRDGKAVRVMNPKIDKDGFSELQRDMMRYVVLVGGLTHTKISFEKAIPIKLKVRWYRAYEDYMNELISDGEKLNNVIDLFELEYAIAHPEGINTIDFNTIKSKSSLVEPGYFADLIVQLPVEQKINNIVKIKNGTRKDGSEKSTIYVKVDNINNNIGEHRFQKVGVSSNRHRYAHKPTKNKATEYNRLDAFDASVRNIRVKDINSKEIEAYDEVEAGEIISVTSYGDFGRQNKKYYKVRSVTKGTKKLSNETSIDVYNLKVDPYNGKLPESRVQEKLKEVSEIEKKLKEDKLKGYAEKGLVHGKKPIGELNLQEEINRIKGSENEYKKKIAETLDKFPTTADMKIYRVNPALNDRKNGFTSFISSMTSSTMIVDTFIVDKKYTPEYEDEIILHEEIHRRTSPILSKYRYAKKHRTDPRRFLSKAEVEFAEEVIALHKEYNKQRTNKPSVPVARDVDEFIAYGLTHPEFIEELKQIKLRKISLLERLIKAIGKLFAFQDLNFHEALTISFDKLAGSNDFSMVNKTFTQAQALTQNIYVGNETDVIVRPAVVETVSKEESDQYNLSVQHSRDAEIYDKMTDVQIRNAINKYNEEIAFTKRTPQIKSAYLEINRIKNYSDIGVHRDIADALSRVPYLKKNLIYEYKGGEKTEENGITAFSVNSNGTISTVTGINISRVNPQNSQYKNNKEYQINYDDAILHEEVHRYTANILTVFTMNDFNMKAVKELGYSTKDVEFAKNILDLWNETVNYIEKNDPTLENVPSRLKNVLLNGTGKFALAEFVAYGLTDPHVVTYLNEIKVEDTSILDRIVDLLSKVLGIKIDDVYNLMFSSFENYTSEGGETAKSVEMIHNPEKFLPKTNFLFNDGNLKPFGYSTIDAETLFAKEVTDVDSILESQKYKYDSSYEEEDALHDIATCAI